MKITCLLGSPRVKGNSEILARTFLDKAESLGAETQVFALNKLKYRGCQGCMGCKTRYEECVIKDDLTEVLDAVRHTDILILATPVYYGDVTSQLKGFIDRTFCYLVPDFHTNPNPSRLAKGKKLVFILPQGDPDQKNFADIFPRYSKFFQWYGFDETYLIRGTGLVDKGSVAECQDIVQQAEQLAGQIVV